MAVTDGVYTAPASWDGCDWENPAGDSADCMLALRQAVEERRAALDMSPPRDGALPGLRRGERGERLNQAAAVALADALFPLFNRTVSSASPAVYLDPSEPVKVTGEVDDDGVDRGNVRWKPVSFRDLPPAAQFWKDLPGAGSTANEWGAWMLKMKNAIDLLHVRNASAYGDLFSFGGTTEYMDDANRACTALRAETAAAYAGFSPAPRQSLMFYPQIRNYLSVRRSAGGYCQAYGQTQCLFVFSCSSRYPVLRASLKYGLWCRRERSEFSNRNWSEGFGEGVVGELDERHQLGAAVRLGSQIQLPTISDLPDDGEWPPNFGRGSSVHFSFYLDFAVPGGFKFQKIQGE